MTKGNKQMTKGIKMRKGFFKRVFGATALVLMTLALLGPHVALADSEQVDDDLAVSGNQNIVSPTANIGSTVTVEGDVAIRFSSGGNHVPVGTLVTFTPDTHLSVMPAGWSASTETVTIPSGWGTTRTEVGTTGKVTFPVTSSTASNTYSAKWTATTDYGNELTGAPALTINLTVNNPLTAPVLTLPANIGNVQATSSAGAGSHFHCVRH